MSVQIVNDKGLLDWLFKSFRSKQKDLKKKACRVKKNGKGHTDEFLAFHEEIEKLKKATAEFKKITVWDEDFEDHMRKVHEQAGIPMPELLQ